MKLGQDTIWKPSLAATPCTPGDPIYIEVTPLLYKNLTGIGRFAARLLDALGRRVPLRLFTITPEDYVRELKLSTSLRVGQDLPLTPADLPPADGDLDAWVRSLLRRPRCRHDVRLANRSAAVFTMLRPPERHFRRELCLLYDFTTFILPWTHTEETRGKFGKLFSQTARLCDRFVAISQTTKADAHWLSGVPADDVVVGYPGPSLCLKGHAHPAPVARRSDLIVVVSTLEPRKNGQFLLDWFLDTKVLPAETELWWVGPEGWLCQRALKRGRRRGGQGRTVKFLGMVPDARLCELYRQAAFTIYPSLYEGFGLPVLDSLRHGTPVLSSFNSSLQEFGGPGLFYFDACDPASLDAAYGELQGSGIIDRDELDRRFSWDALAQTVVSLCRSEKGDRKRGLSP